LIWEKGWTLLDCLFRGGDRVLFSRSKIEVIDGVAMRAWVAR
jgi:hypothetical protein